MLLVEDHVLLAQSLVTALQVDGTEVHVAELSSAAAVLEQAERIRPDVVLLDLDLGEAIGSGGQFVGAFRELGARVVVMTGTADLPRIAACIEAGAAGYVRKDQPFDDLVRAIGDAASSRSLLDPQQRAELFATLRARRREESSREALFARLSSSEQQVLGGLMRGLSAEELARERVVALSTVRSQIRAVLMKLDVSSQLAAVAVARRVGWTPPEPPVPPVPPASG